MNEKQYELTERMEEEYVKYIDDLLTQDKHTIISMSDKTNFYAFMLMHVKERDLTKSALDALILTETPLNDLYLCYMNNNEDYLANTNAAIKVLYQYQKERRIQDQM